jgi:hypothetical protein
MIVRLKQNVNHHEGSILKYCILKGSKQSVIRYLVCLSILLSWQLPVYASEGGSSYYFPGAFATFAVAVAPDAGPLFTNQTLYYHAKVDKAVLQGRVNLSLDATAVYNYFGGFYTLSDPVLGGKLQLGGAVPLGYVSLKAAIDTTLLGSHNISDRDFNIGDSLLLGALYWDTGDFHFKLGEMIFAPTGRYSTSDLANVGRNYWGFDTSCAATWLSSKTGTEISVMPGIMFNTENNATNYKTGNEFHMDYMLNQFLAKNFALGAQGYYYKQVNGDSGSGAKLGDFKGESYGFGPALLWQPGFDNGKLTLIGKWIFDSHRENRMKGDYGQLLISKKF